MTTTRPTKNGQHLARLRWLIVFAALLLAGCSGTNDSFDQVTAASDAGSTESDSAESDSAESDSAGSDSAGSATVDASGEQEQSDADTDEANASEPPGSAATPTPVSAADIARKIVFTAQVEVGVDDVDASGREAVAAIERLGGFVFGQASSGGPEATSEFTFKIPPEDFGRALESLGGIGELRHQRVSADDVTERVVDLQSRIEVSALGVERLRVALDETTTLTEFAQVESLLLARESELEVMRGQFRTLSDQVNLATITLVLSQDRVENNLELHLSFYEEHDGGLGCPGQETPSLEANNPLTICIELVNTGDQTLADLTLADTGLGIESADDVIGVFGSITEPLPPGQNIIMAYEVSPERDLRLRTRVGGQPQTIEGGEPAGPPVSATRNQIVGVRPGVNAAGFSDGFDAGAKLVKSFWRGLLITVGFMIPLLVTVPFIAALLYGLRRLKARRKARRPSSRLRQTNDSLPPPPPTATPLD